MEEKQKAVPDLAFGPIDRVLWFLRVVWSALDRFYWDNGFSKAASLAYCTLLSLFPVTALGFGILASFAVSKDYVPSVREFVFRQFVPSTQAADKVLYYLEHFSSVLSDPSINVTMIGFLLVTSILLINSVEYALNEVWQVYEPRSITDRISIFCAILLIAPVIIISMFFFTKLRLEPFIDNLGVDESFGQMYRFSLPLLIDFLAFVSLYFLVPKAPVKVVSAMIGGAIAALMFGAAKSGFAVYVERFASYDKLYGTIAAVPIFLVWLYLAWIIVLVGAEIAYQVQYLPRWGKVWRRALMSIGDGQFLLALQTLLLVAKKYRQGTKLPGELELAELLGCSTVVLKPALSLLERARILSRGSGRDAPVMLLRSPRAISIKDLKLAIFGDRQGLILSEVVGQVFVACGKQPDSLEELTLDQLVDELEKITL